MTETSLSENSQSLRLHLETLTYCIQYSASSVSIGNNRCV